MPAHVALILAMALIALLLLRDCKQQPQLSYALWIPLLWLLIMGSRPASMWLGVQHYVQDAQLDGSPFDRIVFLLLITAGVLVLIRRRVHWGNIIAYNKWLFIFFLYLGISTLWSDYPIVAFKRWIKDVGNIIMILVVLSESDPIEAVKRLLLRCAYILVPLSVLFIKYFPDLGRYYNPWTWTYSFGGVTTDKNGLGATLIIYGIVLLWKMLDMRDDKARSMDQLAMPLHLLLLGMVAWLFLIAHSQTSFTCALLGVGILLAMRLPSIRSHTSHIEIYVLALALLLVFLNSVFDITGTFVQTLGRDMTISGRTGSGSER